MIVHDTVGGQTEARAQLSSTITDYHEPFDQGLTVLITLISIFIKSVLKSLVILAIWLALGGAISLT